jgi:hypothetical protein
MYSPVLGHVRQFRRVPKVGGFAWLILVRLLLIVQISTCRDLGNVALDPITTISTRPPKAVNVATYLLVNEDVY